MHTKEILSFTLTSNENQLFLSFNFLAQNSRSLFSVCELLMQLSLKSVALTVVFLTVITWAWRVLNWVWLRPKKLEKYLRQQGLSGNSYRFLFGDLKENVIMLKEAKSRPINFDDNIAIRVMPFVFKLFKDYGMRTVLKNESYICILHYWP